LTNDAAVIAKKPLVYGAVFKFEGQVSVFNYHGAATYRCLYPSPPNPEEAPNCSQIGVLPRIIGSLQANETIKIICGIGTVLANKLLIYNVLTMHQMVLSFDRDLKNTLLYLEKDYNFFCGTAVKDEISFEEFFINKEKYNLLDVRETWERDAFNFGGQHIPLAALSARISEVYIDKILVVYCKSGLRSAQAIGILMENNFPVAVLNLKGGCFQ
jgi:adenylyltransferase/sulfurtransferase